MKASLLSDLKTRWRPVYRRRRTINTCQSLMKASLANFRIAIFIITPSDGRTRAVMLCDTWPNNGVDLFLCVNIAIQVRFRWWWRNYTFFSGCRQWMCILYSQRATVVIYVFIVAFVLKVTNTGYWQRNNKFNAITNREYVEDHKTHLRRKLNMFINCHWSFGLLVNDPFWGIVYLRL